jgi:hypothetical protein
MAAKTKKTAPGAGAAGRAKQAGAKNKKPPVRPKKAKQGADTSKKTKKTGKAAQPEDPRESLARELRSLIPRLDAEGLEFLIKQAQVHLYNMQVDELNKTMARSTPKAPAKPKKAPGEIRLEGSGSGSSFYIVYNEQWVMFSREEIIQLVKITTAPGSAPEIAERLFRWFERERRDIFETIPMADYFDGRLKKIAQLIKKNFKIQPKK